MIQLGTALAGSLLSFPASIHFLMEQMNMSDLLLLRVLLIFRLLSCPLVLNVFACGDIFYIFFVNFKSYFFLLNFLNTLLAE